MQFRHTQNTLKTLLLLIFAIIFSYQSWAQTDQETGSIFGTVTDRVTNSPLFGASAHIVDTQKGTMADDNGEYTIKEVPPGTYNLRFLMIGYQTLIKTNVVVSPGRGTEISVSLDQTPIEIESVTVTAKIINSKVFMVL